MKFFLWALVGAIIGGAVVRGFMLDTLEELGFRMFWQAWQENEMTMRSINWWTLVSSATFIKIGLGILAGGGLGAWLGRNSNEA